MKKLFALLMFVLMVFLPTVSFSAEAYVDVPKIEGEVSFLWIFGDFDPGNYSLDDLSRWSRGAIASFIVSSDAKFYWNKEPRWNGKNRLGIETIWNGGEKVKLPDAQCIRITATARSGRVWMFTVGNCKGFY